LRSMKLILVRRVFRRDRVDYFLKTVKDGYLFIEI
jgi:hypothetical protein